MYLLFVYLGIELIIYTHCPLEMLDSQGACAVHNGIEVRSTFMLYRSLAHAAPLLQEGVSSSVRCSGKVFTLLSVLIGLCFIVVMGWVHGEDAKVQTSVTSMIEVQSEHRRQRSYAVRCSFRTAADPGVLAILTNSYCIHGRFTEPKLRDLLASELNTAIPVIPATIGGLETCGCLLAGNKNGLLVPHITTDLELQHIRNHLPEDITIARVSARMTSLGNIICCNDNVALLHPDVDKETEQIVTEVLGVETFRETIASEPLVGTFCWLSNHCGLVTAKTPMVDMEELAQLVQVPLVAGTVSKGSDMVGKGVLANDWAIFCSMQTTATELQLLESLFNLQKGAPMPSSLRRAMIECLV